MKNLALTAVLAMGLTAPAVAHDSKGPHGGVVEHSGAYHVELLAKGKQVDVFVLDEALKPVDHTGQKGLAILVVGGKPARIPLESAGKDRLSGAAPSDIKGAPKGAVQITLTSGTSVQVKY